MLPSLYSKLPNIFGFFFFFGFLSYTIGLFHHAPKHTFLNIGAIKYILISVTDTFYYFLLKSSLIACLFMNFKISFIVPIYKQKHAHCENKVPSSQKQNNKRLLIIF